MAEGSHLEHSCTLFIDPTICALGLIASIRSNLTDKQPYTVTADWSWGIPRQLYVSHQSPLAQPLHPQWTHSTTFSSLRCLGTRQTQVVPKLWSLGWMQRRQQRRSYPGCNLKETNRISALIVSTVKSFQNTNVPRKLISNRLPISMMQIIRIDEMNRR